MTDTICTLHQWQRQWLATILDAGFVSKTGDSSDARAQPLALAVYWNNIQQRLEESLAFHYPALLNAVGAEKFNVLALEFIAENLPEDPDLMRYGHYLPCFLNNRADIPKDYLDIAHLESFLNQCAWVARQDTSFPLPVIPISLGTYGGQKLSLVGELQIWRTTSAVLEHVAAHYDLDLCFLDGQGWNASPIFGIWGRLCAGHLSYRLLSAGEYAFLRFISSCMPFEKALLWGLYSQPEGHFAIILDELLREGYLTVLPASNGNKRT